MSSTLFYNIYNNALLLDAFKAKYFATYYVSSSEDFLTSFYFYNVLRSSNIISVNISSSFFSLSDISWISAGLIYDPLISIF